MLLEPAGRGQHFQDRFSISCKVTSHQFRHIARNIPHQMARHITRHITLYITRPITLQKTRQITRDTTRQIPLVI